MSNPHETLKIIAVIPRTATDETDIRVRLRVSHGIFGVDLRLYHHERPTDRGIRLHAEELDMLLPVLAEARAGLRKLEEGEDA